MLYEGEPMDINEASVEHFEEGEINSSGDEESITVQMPANVSGIFSESSHKEKTDGFVTGLNIFDQNETQKKLDRAKRFSLPLQNEDSVEVQKQKLFDLYRDLRIDKENERHYRFNAIHMRGTENMSTEDVLQYFSAYAPSHIEWINYVSCNVIWKDDVSAARALLYSSRKVKNIEKIHSNADPFEKDFNNKNAEPMENDEAIDVREIKAAIPPGFWRIGLPCEKSSSILMRFATRSDKKQKNVEKNSEYYKNYGNPHLGNIPGLISDSLRTELKKSKMKASDSNFLWENYAKKGPEKKNPWEELAYEWGQMDNIEESNRKFLRNNIKERGNSVSDLRISLKNKKKRHKRSTSETSLSPLSDKEVWGSRSKIPKMKMYADVEEEKLGKNFERKIQSKQFKGQSEKDLRNKINKKKSRTRFNFKTQTEPKIGPSKESFDSGNEYDDGDSADWALEHYHDLRESLQQSKRLEHKRCNRVKYESDSGDNDGDGDYDGDNNDDDGDDDDMYIRDISQRSPLQIEITNDEYYFNKQLKTK